MSDLVLGFFIGVFAILGATLFVYGLIHWLADLIESRW